jgi:hypothetical protein
MIFMYTHTTMYTKTRHVSETHSDICLNVVWSERRGNGDLGQSGWDGQLWLSSRSTHQLVMFGLRSTSGYARNREGI